MLNMIATETAANTTAAIAGATGNASKDTGNDNSLDTGGGCEVCRVCGAEQPEAPWGDDGETPTYDICNCCGVEFGYEDSTVQSIKKYRAKWLDSGAKWMNKKSEPQNWSVDEQLAHIPLKYR
ncbi:TPA: hypothetical protein ACYZY7_004714 [Escherichia coli]|jgi:hypothetical protein|nr:MULTISPECIES: hypothetical protein [Enterobacteriaceae]MCW3227928.1 hypothetical protein [Escherichia coli]MCW7174579.1 hypothetical protein [Escherichia coli]MCW7265248.1 hypothetical protein [Escherichia coli]MCW7413817.1 hypothetical protein [Escherichia coli]MCX0011619.1 hypothetical protein [Escherichia coli]